MISSGDGFIFDGRYDSNGNIGVTESYEVSFKGNIQSVRLTTAMDNDGNLSKLYFLDAGVGFLPLSSLIDSNKQTEDIERFIRSHKMLFFNLNYGRTYVVADLKFNIETGELLEEKSSIGLYVIKNASLDKDSNKVSVLCDRIGVKSGLNTAVVEELTYKSYKANFLKNMTMENTKSKADYISFRLA